MHKKELKFSERLRSLFQKSDLSIFANGNELDERRLRYAESLLTFRSTKSLNFETPTGSLVMLTHPNIDEPNLIVEIGSHKVSRSRGRELQASVSVFGSRDGRTDDATLAISLPPDKTLLQHLETLR